MWEKCAHFLQKTFLHATQDCLYPSLERSLKELDKV